MRTATRLGVLVLVPALAAACRPMTRDAADRAAADIKAVNASWREAAARRDLDGMMAIYAPDARELLPGLPPIIGPDAIRAFYGDLIDRYPRFAHRFTPEEITVAGAGDLAVVQGTFRFTPDALEPDVVQAGKYVGVWRRREGAWRLFLNISNGNQPTPPGP